MSGLEQLYQQIILDHAKRRVGDGLQEPAPGHASGESHQHNPICGDQIQLRVELDGTRIVRISWDGTGCSISMAAASVLTELAEGVERDELIGLIDQFREVMRSRGSVEADEEVLGDGAAFAGVAKFPARVKCAMLAWVAAETALLAAA
ncbi:Fe-S cluster assembly sulfur transfer protein SufU [Zhihengliuella salsuginis]|uniref:Iron-sulfur cluster assembly scaffold protein NifU n=1 Tax=Zhihengliuella salsuginis TaxID=578222 RepID=A0ABQ3GKI9_9MICC|nr:SUF system NifU family Fe-S cluster assembly protein [Zhihengliuella salsuginis]GHD09837.1 iron-sulfur cluster assembly scaffold protein NifU [Zhihengliuella salsuginis]